MHLKRFHHVMRTGRLITAVFGKQGRNKPLVKSDENYEIIAKNNILLKTAPYDNRLLYERASSRDYLEDNVLSEFDFLGFKAQLENIKSNPNEAIKYPTLNRDLAEIYSRLASIYSRYEIF